MKTLANPTMIHGFLGALTVNLSLFPLCLAVYMCKKLSQCVTSEVSEWSQLTVWYSINFLLDGIKIKCCYQKLSRYQHQISFSCGIQDLVFQCRVQTQQLCLSIHTIHRCMPLETFLQDLVWRYLSR